MEKVKSFVAIIKGWSLRRKIFFGVLLLIIILIVLKSLGGNNDSKKLVLDTVKSVDLIQSVKATGKVTSKTDLSLSFNASGVVRSVRAEVGDKVYSGQILATLDQGAELASLTQAEGAVASARAKYDKILNSFTNEEIYLARILLDNAKNDYNKAKEQQDLLVANALNELNKRTYDVVDYERNKFEYDNAINTRTTTLTTLQAVVNQRQAELDIKLADPNNADVALAKADITTALGKLQEAQANLEHRIVRAPANGTITKVDIKIGELSETNKEVIVLQDVSNLYIEANINEANITNVKLNQEVKFTLDALPEKEFKGTIVQIDPSATVDDGVVNYKVKSSIIDKDENIRVGMNTNLIIVGGEKPGVLAIPRSAVSVVDGRSMVKVVINENKKKYEERDVITGFLGDGNMLEIVSGLSLGERIAFVQ